MRAAFAPGRAKSVTAARFGVQRYIPEFEKRWDRYARPVYSSWRMDETAVSVRGGVRYLYRAKVNRSAYSVRGMTALLALGSPFLRRTVSIHDNVQRSKGHPRAVPAIARREAKGA
jgi:hypothetical protein